MHRRTPYWLRFTTDPGATGGSQPHTAPEPPADVPPDPGGQPPQSPSDQPSLGDAGKKALAEERKARRDAEKALNAEKAKVKAFEQRDLSEQERMTQQLAEATARAEKAETDALRLRIANEEGLGSDLLEFLDGTADEEQMRARAKKLKAAMAVAPPPTPPDFGGGHRGDDPTSVASLDQQIADALKAGDMRLSIALKRQRQALVQAGK